MAASESFVTYRNRRLFAPSRSLERCHAERNSLVVLAVGLPLHGSRAERRMWPRDSDLSKLSKPKAGAQLLGEFNRPSGSLQVQRRSQNGLPVKSI